MSKEDSRKKIKFPTKLILIFVIGLVLGAVIQLVFVQPLMDNSDSFKSKLATCELSRQTCDKEVGNYFSCMESNNLNPNDCT